jgi:hypothetical protein
LARKPETRRIGYLWRFARGMLAMEFLLLATWNPWGTSYVAWVARSGGVGPLQAVAGIALLIGHVALLRIAFVALGYPGILAGLLLVGCAVLAAWQLGLADLNRLQAEPLFWLAVWAAIVSLGITWAAFQKRLSGQRGVLKSPP